MTALTLFTARAQAEPVAAKELARRRYEDGLASVDRGEFARALAAFEEAYALSPHPIVLYNIGLAQSALDRPREAATTLRRYLDEAGGDVSAERRAAVEQQIGDLERQLPPVATAPTAPTVPVTVAAVVPPPPAALADSPPPSQLGPSLLMGGGVALVGGALGLRLWNDGRYTDWEAERAELARARPPVSPAEADAIDARRSASNGRLSDIRRADAVVWGALAAGATALVAGAVWWWSNRRPSAPSHQALGPGGASW